MCTRMVILHQSGSVTPCHPRRTYRCIKNFTSFRPDQIRSRHKSTLVIGKVVCLVCWVELLVGFLGGSVLEVDLDGVVNKIQLTSGFVLQVVLAGSLGDSDACTLHIYCVI